jgi:hypothetical protein
MLLSGLCHSHTLVGIQKHFMVADIPGFDFPNRLSGLTTSLFSRDGIGKLIFNKVKSCKLNNCTIIENQTPGLWHVSHNC